MNKLRENARRILTGASFAMFTALNTVNNVFCSTQEKAIWDIDDKVEQNLTGAIVSVYKTLFWPFLLLHVLIFVFSKDDKKKGYAKYTCIGICVAYVLCLIQGVVTGSLNGIGDFFVGSVKTF